MYKNEIRKPALLTWIHVHQNFSISTMHTLIVSDLCLFRFKHLTAHALPLQKAKDLLVNF